MKWSTGRNGILMVFLLAAACATLEEEVLQAPSGFVKPAGFVKLVHFSFLRPDPSVWALETADNLRAEFTAWLGNTHYRIALLENFLMTESMKDWSAKAIADDYRNQEKQDMVTMGVNTGLYELNDLTMGEETVGEKLYYTMKYSTKQKSAYQNARLYLFFPSETGRKFSWLHITLNLHPEKI